MAKGDIRRVIGTETGAADHHASSRTFPTRQIEHVVHDDPLECVMRPHPIRRMDCLVVKAVKIGGVRAINRDLAAVDEPGNRIGKAKILVLGIAPERGWEEDQRHAAAISEREHLEIAAHVGRPPFNVALVHWAFLRGFPTKQLRDFSTSPKRRAMPFALHAAEYTYRKHPATPRVSLENSEEPPGRSRLSAARLSPIFDPSLPGALSARRPERVRCRDVVWRRGMGSGRDGATVDPPKVDRAHDHRGGRQHWRGSDR